MDRAISELNVKNDTVHFVVVLVVAKTYQNYYDSMK